MPTWPDSLMTSTASPALRSRDSSAGWSLTTSTRDSARGQRGQGVKRHSPGEPSPQRIGYAEPGLCVLSWLESDHSGSAVTLPSSDAGAHGAARRILPKACRALMSADAAQSRKVKPLMAR